MREQYRIIARVEKSHGRRGEVVTVPVHGLPPLMRPGLEVYIVPPRLTGPRSLVLEGVSDRSGAGQLVSFEGVHDMGEAEALQGHLLLARDSDLPEGIGLHDASTLIGREVTDEEGRLLGRVAELITGPANDAWVIEGERELLVPVVDSVVLSGASEDPIVISSSFARQAEEVRS